MAYLKLDDNAPHNRKLLAAGDVAAWLWICGLAYCQRHATDGYITREAVPILGCTGWKSAAPRLLAAGLWRDVEGGYQVHDFLKWNDSAEARRQKTEDGNKRVAALRERRKDAQNVTRNITPTPSPTPTPIPPTAENAVGSARATPAGADLVVSGPKRHGGLIQRPGQWGDQHSAHVVGFCDWVCLPTALFDDFVGRLLGAGQLEPAARADVSAWATGVRLRWAASGQVPGDDIFRFWRHEWQATHGSNRPAPTASTLGQVDALAGVREAIRRG